VRVEVRKIELALAVAFLILGVLIAMASARMPMGTPSLPGPGFLPLILGALIAGTAALIGVRSLRARDSGEPVQFGHVYIAVTVAALIAAGLAFERIGFVPTVAAFMFVMLAIISPLGWWRSAVAAAVVTVACYLFFGVVLGIRLPPMPFWP